jgi:hypothetical protein
MKMKKPPVTRETSKPHLRTRKLNMAGKSAFPGGPLAFDPTQGPAGPSAGMPPMMPPGMGMGAAPGDTGQ